MLAYTTTEEVNKLEKLSKMAQLGENSNINLNKIPTPLNFLALKASNSQLLIL